MDEVTFFVLVKHDFLDVPYRRGCTVRKRNCTSSSYISIYLGMDRRGVQK